MILPYPPPWQDMKTLCAHICASDRTVEEWVKLGLLPPPRLVRGKRMWKWREVERYLDRDRQGETESSHNDLGEDIYAATERAINVRARRT